MASTISAYSRQQTQTPLSPFQTQHGNRTAVFQMASAAQQQF